MAIATEYVRPQPPIDAWVMIHQSLSHYLKYCRQSEILYDNLLLEIYHQKKNIRKCCNLMEPFSSTSTDILIQVVTEKLY